MTDNGAYETIGRITVAWNRIEYWWQLIFVTMLDAPRDQADAIYLSLATFSPQRDICRSLAGVCLAPHPNTLTRVLALDDEIGKEVGARNVTIHSRYIGSKTGPTLTVDHPHRSRTTKHDLIGKDVAAELSATLNRLEALDGEAWATLAAVCAALGREMP